MEDTLEPYQMAGTVCRRLRSLGSAPASHGPGGSETKMTRKAGFWWVPPSWLAGGSFLTETTYKLMQRGISSPLTNLLVLKWKGGFLTT